MKPGTVADDACNPSAPTGKQEAETEESLETHGPASLEYAIMNKGQGEPEVVL